jgi:glycosyltransferase involved in cell wall biosynthesis
MNVIHALASYFPENTGGTEVYVSGLARELDSLGAKNCVVAAGMASADYEREGIPVHRYPFGPADLATVRGDREPVGFDRFTAWLGRQPKGVYHQHSWTASCGLRHLVAAKTLGFATVLTVHLPGNICLRGTMMEFGTRPCDGRVEAGRCADCWSQARGLPSPLSKLVSWVPSALSRVAYASGAENSLVTALAALEFASKHRRQIEAMSEAADRVVAVCGWLADALRQNDVEDTKIVVSRQGVDKKFIEEKASRRGTDKFRLGFLGRCAPVKGLHVLIDAVSRLPQDIPFELVIHAVADGDEERQLRDRLIAKTADDPRIAFLPPLPRSEVAGALASFDMLAVPSQWLETGPLVVLEAQASKIPVLGSNLGGIAELVTPGVDGHLVDFADPAAWAEAIRAAVSGTLPCLRHPRAVRPIRTMADAARDMATLYADLA